MQTGRRRPVCMVTAQNNDTAEAIVMELDHLDVPVLRFDLADFPHNVQLDASFVTGRWTGTITTRGQKAALEELAAVCWWHPGTARINAQPNEPETEWLTREATAGLAGVLASLKCLHLNHPVATHAAQCKPLALAEAARAGLSVLPTWIGNTLPGASAFAATAGPLVCKSLTVPGIDALGLFFPTTRIEPATLDDSISGTAHQLQHYVDKQFEVRLTVVGRQMFAARINAHSQAARVDFRNDYDALSYEPIDVPEPVRAGVTAWLRTFGLAYAAIDLLVDHDGRWWPIDLNPAGQFGWIQHHQPELKITTAIAALLADPDHITSSVDQTPTPSPPQPAHPHPQPGAESTSR